MLRTVNIEYAERDQVANPHPSLTEPQATEVEASPHFGVASDRLVF